MRLFCRPLRSAGSESVLVPRAKTKHGEAAFSFSCSNVHQIVRLDPLLTTFKSKLKTYLFITAFNFLLNKIYFIITLLLFPFYVLLPVYSGLLDSVAPLSFKTRRSKRSTPWFTKETMAFKQACWRLDVFYIKCVLNYKCSLFTAKSAYFSLLISNNKHHF